MGMTWPWTKIPTPDALPSSLFPNKPGEYTWEDWERDARKLYPVRFWLQHDVPRFLSRVYYPVGNFFYWVRTHTYNRYHIVNLKCPTWGLEYAWGWVDRSEALLIANFQILKDFMEREFPGHCDWDADIHHQEAARELKELYAWWILGRKMAWDEHRDLISASYRGRTRGSADLAHLYKKSLDLEEQDDVMLLRLVKVRKYMWT